MKRRLPADGGESGAVEKQASKLWAVASYFSSAALPSCTSLALPRCTTSVRSAPPTCSGWTRRRRNGSLRQLSVALRLCRHGRPT